MKPHFKKIHGKWNVYENRGDKSPVIITSESLWSANIDFVKWEYLQNLINKREPNNSLE